MPTMTPTCELCATDGGELLYRDAKLRIVLVNDADYPAFCRVIWNAHVREMTDLPAVDRYYLLNTVMQVEALLREVLRPDKINLASLGNVVPHLHWHVIPRFTDDWHFPAPVWATPQREVATAHSRPNLAECLRERLATLHQHP